MISSHLAAAVRNTEQSYLGWKSNKNSDRKIKGTHLERVKSEVVLGRENVAWDVHTDEPGRWSVIIGPTNLNSQETFPSLDYTISLHVGLGIELKSGRWEWGRRVSVPAGGEPSSVGLALRRMVVGWSNCHRPPVPLISVLARR